MAKAKRNIQEHLKLVDLVIELLDARIPYSSQNPDIASITEKKPRIIVLNKADLASPEITEEWIEYFQKQSLIAVPVDSQRGIGLNMLTKQIKNLMKDKLEYWKKRGRKPRAFRAMVLGIPNVGKSSLINRFAKKKSAKIGDRPGITKGLQWIKFSGDLELLDVPGILWPKFEEEEVGYKLALTGAIASHLFDPVEMINHLILYLPAQQKEEILKQYDLTGKDQVDITTLLTSFGKSRGFLMQGGEVDLDKSARNFLLDFQKGKLGRITLEQPKK